MASSKERVGYIANYLKKLGAPSETAIAICCNIKAESNFDPQAVEIGHSPPFTKSGVGFGLFQFSNYPDNQRIYSACRALNDKQAIEWQIDELIRQCQPGKGNWFNSVNYPTFNLSWNEFFKNTRHWTPRNLTFAFMRQYERPADQSQDRYTLYQAEIRDLYDWSKYDSNGGDNSNNGDNEVYNFDCGGSRIPPSDGDGGTKPPDPPSGNNMTPRVKRAFDEVEDHYKRKVAGWRIKGTLPPPYGPYQCVGLMQHFLKTADPAFRDAILGTAYQYGTTIHAGLQANRTVMGLSPKKWQWIARSFKKGDVIFYRPAPANGKAGHVNVASSSQNAYNQNITAPYLGNDPLIRKSAITAVGSVYGAIRKITD